MVVPDLPASGETPGSRAETRSPSSAVVALLAALVALLAITTVGFGGAVVWLTATAPGAIAATTTAARPTHAVPSSTPTPTATTALPPVPLQQVQGIDVGVVSTFELGEVVMARSAPGEISVLHALVTNPLDTAASPTFDVTSYDADGRIVSRHVSVLYLLPHQETLFRGFLSGDLTRVDRVLIEQIGPASEEPTAAAGALSLTALAGNGGSRATATISSTLDTEAKLAEVFLVGTVDGDIVVVGNAVTDIPAGASFTVDIPVYLATRDDPQQYAAGVPADADYEVYFELVEPR